MNKAIEILGHIAGVLGLLCCLFSGGIRLTGQHTYGNFLIESIFILGIGLMVAACLAKLHLLSQKKSRPAAA